jgi:nitroreductase
MNVSEAVQARTSVRAFQDRPVDGDTVREILEAAARAPSGGNLQPWRVFALAGQPLEQLKTAAAASPFGETPEYAVYPPALWEPFRTRRFTNGEQLYSSVGAPREDKARRLAWFARNREFFGAPVGLIFCLDRRLGSPQWADLGMYMMAIMLLAQERGLATCAQEYWAIYPRTLAEQLQLPEELMVFAGMALGYAAPAAPINGWRSEREQFEQFAEMRGF